jgi:predicted acylesterase/phospholipase RssA
MSATNQSSGPDVRYCDLIMKGGLTSGVVYPMAVYQLAKDFHFRNIGGTSAGAIIAAATAAAELGGRGQPNAGFERLKQFPSWFGIGTHHFDLFQPQESTRGVFEVAFALVGHEGWVQKAVRLAGKAVWYFWPWVLAGLLPGLGLVWVLGSPSEWKHPVGAALFVAVLLLVGILAAVTTGFLIRASFVIPANNFGLSRGYDRAENPERPRITSWLDRELDQLAGRDGAAAPLTFGDLWGPGGGGDLVPPVNCRRINLEVMTTCLTLGRPYRLPFAVDRKFYFDPAEFGSYFPPRVVQHCIRRAAGPATTSAGGREIYPLPVPRDLPVVVAVRMSLSFPLLFSAVPLYTDDFGRPLDKRRPPERCWFTDGGITSNMPVHFFDSPIPRWPTFAINLRPFTADYPRSDNEVANVWMPKRLGEGFDEWWSRLEVDQATERPVCGPQKLANFLWAMLDTALNWRDNIQLHAPGYCERVVHVKVDDSAEGGLNLRIDPVILRRLTQRGTAAGDLIRSRYVDKPSEPKAVSWLSHRWTRYRTAMQVEQERLGRMVEAYDFGDSYTKLLGDLIDRPKGASPDVYEWDDDQRSKCPREATERLLEIWRLWASNGVDFARTAPTPYPELRLNPKL